MFLLVVPFNEEDCVRGRGGATVGILPNLWGSPPDVSDIDKMVTVAALLSKFNKYSNKKATLFTLN